MRSLLREFATSDADGRALLGTFPGDQVVVATKGMMRSGPWRGPGGSEIELVIGDTFFVEGTLSLPSWDSDYVGERRITIAAEQGPLVRILASVNDVQAGGWGPVALPALMAERYTICLEGSPIVPLETHFRNPLPGDRLVFHLAAELGEELWFQAVDERDQPITNSRVQLMWKRGGAWCSLNVQARPDGYVDAWSVPPGTVTHQMFAPGFAPSNRATMTVPLAEASVTQVRLQKSGTVTGHCLYLGQPVQDFEVVLWPQEKPTSRTKHSFHGRNDGSFVIYDIPTGIVMLSAAGEEHPGSVPVSAIVSPGETASVDIELPSARTGLGVVVDATSGEAVPEATVQLYYTGIDRAITALGAPHTVGPDGRFAIEGFTEHQNFYFVEAPGYSGFYSSISPEEAGPVDLGRIELSPLRQLQIALIPAEPTDRPDFSGYGFSGHGPTALSGRRFPSNGILLFDEVSAGEYSIRIERPNGSVFETRSRLSGDQPWRLAYHVEGERRLTVKLVSKDQPHAAEHCMVSVEYVTTSGQAASIRDHCDRDLAATFSGIEADIALVRAYLWGSGETLALKRCDLRTTSFLELPIDDAARTLLITVKDQDGIPVSDLRIDVEDPEERGQCFAGTTNESGEVRLFGVPEKRMVAHLQKASVGRHYGVPCDATASSIELTFLVDAAADFRVRDGATPLDGVSCSLRGTLGNLENTVRSGVDGRGRIAPLGPGEYDLHCERPDCWPVTARVLASEPAVEETIQMRRLGTLDIVVRTAEGVAAGGVGIDLHCVELDESVAAWRAEGRLVGGELATDGRGRLTLGGIPHGEYRWRIALGGGEWREGVVTAAVEDPVTVQVVLP